MSNGITDRAYQKSIKKFERAAGKITWINRVENVTAVKALAEQVGERKLLSMYQIGGELTVVYFYPALNLTALFDDVPGAMFLSLKTKKLSALTHFLTVIEPGITHG